MVNDDYEILPHGELEAMRSDIKQIKENPFGQTETGQTMLDAMNNLTTAINRLLGVLETANDELVRDYEENKSSDRMDMVIEQNTKLAEGMVAVAELVKSVQHEQRKTAAFSAGLDEVSEFGTEVKAAPKQSKSNPFGAPSPGENVKLDKNLPRQKFHEMDPDFEPAQASTQNTADADMHDDLPSVKGLPPPPKGMAPIKDVPPPQ